MGYKSVFLGVNLGMWVFFKLSNKTKFIQYPSKI